MTLAFALRPHPEELLYSLIARRGRLLGVANGGLPHGRLYALYPGSAGLPRNVPRLADEIGSEWTAEHLVVHHTTLPYYQRFSSREEAADLHGWMMDGTAAPNRGPLRTPPRTYIGMKCCPNCVEEDLAGEIGEAGWRRVHSLPGVCVCPHHGVPLRITAAGQSQGINLLAPPADVDGCGPETKGIRGSGALEVARGSLWLLQNPASASCPPVLRSALFRVLTGDGWLRDGCVQPGLRRELIAHYGKWQLKDLGCGLRENPRVGDWLGRLWDDDDRHMKQPLHYLLLLAFLGRHVSELFVEADAVADLRVTVDEGRSTAREPHVIDPARTTAKHKSIVLEAMRQMPSAGRSELRTKVGYSIGHLDRKDPVWLDRHLPPPRDLKTTVRGWRKKAWSVVS